MLFQIHLQLTPCRVSYIGNFLFHGTTKVQLYFLGEIRHRLCILKKIGLRWPDTIYSHFGYIFESRVLA